MYETCRRGGGGSPSFSLARTPLELGPKGLRAKHSLVVYGLGFGFRVSGKARTDSRLSRRATGAAVRRVWSLFASYFGGGEV